MEQGQQHTLIWDLPLRLFHWFLVISVTIAGLTGFLAPAWWLDVHVYAGYGLGILLAFRLAWGLVGSHYSKFRTFPLGIRGVVRHLYALISRKPAQQADFDPRGHNPVGAWVIIILIGVLVVLVATGLVVLGGQENLGPLAFATNYPMGRLAKQFHEFAAWGLGGVIAIHLTGVFVENVLLRHPVLKAMVTGQKPISADQAAVRGQEAIAHGQEAIAHGQEAIAHGQEAIAHGQGPVARGAVFFSLTAALLIGLGAWLADKPASGYRALATPAVYAGECGDCHHAYHPSLRSETTWRAIMAGLDDHYGEDASVDATSAKVIEAFLTSNAAGTFDTQVAQRIGRFATPDFRITRTRYWKHRHHDIPAAVYRHKKIGSRVNCKGCHGDADSGLYANSEIHFPDGAQQ